MQFRNKILPALALAISSCAAARYSDSLDKLVVIGRLENLSYASWGDPDDVLGHGWITARLHISRVLRGHVPSRVITVRYFAHSYLQDMADVRRELRRDENGDFLVCAPPGDTGFRCR